MTYNKKIASLLFILLFSVVAICQNPPKRPDPPKLVNDYTNTLTEDQKQSLENKLVAFDDSTSTQIAVVIISSLDGNEVAQYNIALGRAWGVGGKEFNNGVVLLIAKEDHKLNIATGYGVEGALPDVTCKHIIDEVIVPNLKENDFYRGVDEGTDAIIKAVKGEYTTPSKKSSGKGSGGIFIFIIIIVVFLLISGRGGGGKGGFMSRRGSIFGPLILSNLLGGGGSGGGWSGGGSSGGGGGFGGFGGGSFGGGGASGSW